ncbi:hypothetical protein LEN26_006360 [Aphanomyces euteiches]|nr:hypothetical protein AeMF1_003066 [Aphanomyces euteiches]KAH9135844.1 hypothetical protein LEN26_006360 [Aphanomyces euteiches]KAH9191872.1 hypothetical protein AeNC1_006158 [Aphanomyces euteiches]
MESSSYKTQVTVLSMIPSEYRAIRDAFNRHYVTKREWPLRIEKPIVGSPTISKEGSVERPPSPPARPINLDEVQFEEASFILRDAINDGFPFTFDRMGNSLVVLFVDSELCPTLSVGSLVVAVNGATIRLDETTEISTRHDEYDDVDQMQEALMLQMINFFKAHGVSAKTSTPCNVRFVKTPTKIGVVRKWNSRSKYKPWSTVYLKMQCGYLNYYPTEDKAVAATAATMQDSLVSVNVVNCTVAATRDDDKFGFAVTEIPPKPREIASDSPEDEVPIPEDEENQVVEPEALMELIGTKSLIEKVIVRKEPKSLRFRVASAVEQAAWLAHIHAAQTFRAEDYVS